MFTIAKKFGFEAMHVLKGLADGHPCMTPHGHSYHVEFQFQGQTLNEHNFLVDYRAMDPIADWIKANLDHNDLNKAIPQGRPGENATTAENIAHYLFDMFHLQYPQLVAVRVSETEKTWAEYRP
jgi:6-pyruvoyltetrahydropterin/6-carboxytetrahydropterin synthase